MTVLVNGKVISRVNGRVLLVVPPKNSFSDNGGNGLEKTQKAWPNQFFAIVGNQFVFGQRDDIRSAPIRPYFFKHISGSFSSKPILRRLSAHTQFRFFELLSYEDANAPFRLYPYPESDVYNPDSVIAFLAVFDPISRQNFTLVIDSNDLAVYFARESLRVDHLRIAIGFDRLSPNASPVLWTPKLADERGQYIGRAIPYDPDAKNDRRNFVSLYPVIRNSYVDCEYELNND